MNTRLIPSRSYPHNFVDHLRTLAHERAGDTALLAVKAQGDEWIEQPLDYATLDLRVRACAAVLQNRFVRGARALLLMDNDEHYVIGFLACLYAGLIAVPVFPPESVRAQHLARLFAIARDARAQCVMTTRELLPLIGDAGIAQLTGAVVLTVDGVENDHAAEWRAHTPHADDIVFLQYTSGSTAAPKGVMVTHHNLMINARAFEEGMSISAGDIFVSWLPLYHDMGLIGGLLQPLHRGVPVILTSPGFFIERPVRWLEAISRYRATVSGAPNFAFQLCVDRVRDLQLQALDLSTWRVAFSGAEPVRSNTMHAFIERFKPAGFPAGTIYPCYGLAESTLFVTGGVRGEGMKAHEFSPQLLAQGRAEITDQGMPAVACGFPASNHTVRIFDPEKMTPVADGRVGEIWTSGPSLASGYWQRPRESAETFLLHEGMRWLRTGDLGFIHARQLYIMGRLKDLIIIRGQNIYPQDIELVIEEHVEAVRKGRVAAFAVENKDTEGIGVAVEVSRSMQKLVAAQTLVEVLNEAVSASCHEPLSVVVLLNPGALPKTSSGKLQRSACRQGWLERTLDAYAIYESGHFISGGNAPASRPLLDDTERAVAAIWEELLQRAGLGREDHFFALGGNSLMAVQAVARISAQWHIPFTPRNLFQYPRLHECAAEINRLITIDSVHSIPAIESRARSAQDPVNGLPLSFGQQRLWFLWQLDPCGTAYHVQHALRLSGELDRHALQAGFQDLIARHEPLRTIFRTGAAGMAEQVIQSVSPLTISETDLRHLPAAQHEQRAAREAEDIVARPFDLTQGPLLRVGLLRMTEKENIIIIVMHHIISDGVSMQILLDEFAACYQAHAQGKAVCLDPLPVQYADYTLWQKKWLEAGEKDKQLAYWKNYLGAEHPLLTLAADQARQPVTSYPAARYRFDLPRDGLEKLRGLALERGATLFMLLLAAFQVLLFRHTGQQDIRTGVPLANRNRIETSGLIGFFVNTQVIRSQLHDRMTFSALLQQLREDVINAQACQDLPFEQLVEALHPQRDLRHNPLFQVTINHLQKDYRALQQLSGLAVDEYRLPEQAAQLELRLETIESPDGSVSADFIYAANLFEPDFIAQLARHFLCILQAMADRPEMAIGDADLLDDADKRKLKVWGSDAPYVPGHQLVHRLIEYQADQYPQLTAVITDHAELSYAALNRRANRLAHRLINAGVKPEMRVGIAVERSSVELTVALLAILKAGGCYVPLDPEYPVERLRHMVDDSGIQMLLTQSHFRTRMPHRDAMTIIELDAPDGDAGLETNPEVALHEDNLAYVIYTSGSTGLPKGVTVAHGALAMHLAAIKKIYDVQPGDRELMFFSLNFDAAAEQWMAPLTEGAALVLSSAGHVAGEGFAELIEKHRITILHLPPAYLRMLLPMMAGKRQCIRTCIAGGEAWYAADVMAARALFRHARLVNAYGPTETVITPTAWVNPADQDNAAQTGAEYAPIGRPVGARNLYVLDQALNLVPPGTAGELYIGGRGLARGYLDRPELTGERFVADPFDQAGGRLYRTGDRVRWRRDGQLEYLGRLDQQIKLRGFRVELGEIEARLLAQPGVREAVVMAQEGRQGLHLVAYLTVHDEARLDAPLLRSALANGLPGYMIPSLFVFLAALPLNPNGKIDRKALPPPGQFDKPGYQAPVNGMEIAVAEIWAEALEIDQAGLHDNFFDLGGHSLLLIRIKQKLEARLNVRIAMVDLFRYTTVADLAKFLSQGARASASLPHHQQRAQRQRAAFIQRKQKIERTQ